MVFRTHSRFLQASSVFLLISSLGCFFGGDSRLLKNGDDLLIRGSSPNVRLLDTIPGDAILTGGDVTFSGAAGGDYLGAGGSQKISGRIHGSIRSVGGEVHAMGSVDRNATIAGGNVSLDSTGVIGGNAYFAGGNVSVTGSVKGSLLASGGEVTINGPIGRDVEVSGGSLHLGPRAQIAGNLRYRVPQDKVRIDPGAHIAGSTTALPVQRGPGMRSVLWMLGFVIAGIVLVALFPSFTTGAAEILHQRTGRSALLGLGWFFLLPFAAIIAAVTVIGLPLASIALAAWVIAAFVGDLPVALWLGKRLLGARARPGRTGAILCVLVGGLILVVVAIIPVVGGFFAIFASILGIGAILLRFRALRATEPEYAI